MSTTKTLLSTAFAIGSIDDPQFAAVEISEAGLLRIEQIANVCRELQLSRAIVDADIPLATFGIPTDGDETAFEDENRLVGHEIHISGRHIWWRAEPKHGEGDAVESHMVAIPTLREAFQSDATTLYLRNGQIDPTLAADVQEASACTL